MLKAKTYIPMLAVVYFLNLNQAIAIESDVNLWKETTAQFTLSKENKANLKLDNTVLELILKQSNKSIDDVLESDKTTLMSFSIKYEAPVKLENDTQAKPRFITQYGLYRTLDSRVQAHFSNDKSNTVKIRFASSDPVLVEFLIDGVNISSPVLVTNTIDSSWVKK